MLRINNVAMTFFIVLETTARADSKKKKTLEPKVRISVEFNTYILSSILKQLFKFHLNLASSTVCLCMLRTSLIITHLRIFVPNSC